ncbi:MAG: Nif11 family protein [Selenomonadaceae bacterium]|nr:Nif11 family protein [Selenomonadaceae bacterium]
MKGFKEFKSRIESDAEFAAKFKGVENESQAIALAKAEGYDLEQLSDEELDNVAGGSALGDKIKQAWDWITS